MEGHVWELKFKYHNRIFYCLPKGETIYLLHACKKQKNKTEMKDKHLALRRAKEVND
ncbi:MAG: type II toxin-antitoxin system RelE/ParE family toxin [Erysipelothrix sp.]|nr:type II toxin-antitoxin system RelE/ParE family toxin [Erysipelothrix sp.]